MNGVLWSDVDGGFLGDLVVMVDLRQRIGGRGCGGYGIQ